MPTQTHDRPGLSWEAICHDPRFRDLPYKIETNARGQIIMSPTYPRHGRLAFRIAQRLENEHSDGLASVELAVQTSEGVKVTDAVWCSKARWERIQDALAVPVAPEICVEVRSPGNADDEMDHKRALYLEAGADEVWICDTEGHLRFYDANGERETSARVPQIGRAHV